VSRSEVRLCGFGGQGIVLAGYILGKAAALYDNKNASFTPSYGPESRGGACAAEVVIAEEQIDYPRLTCADVLVALSQEGYDKYAGEVRQGGLLITEADLVDPRVESPATNRLAVPATRLAESMGRKIVANIIALGFLAAHWPVITAEALRKSISTTVPKGTEELNLRAFEVGRRYSPEGVASAPAAGEQAGWRDARS